MINKGEIIDIAENHRNEKVLKCNLEIKRMKIYFKYISIILLTMAVGSKLTACSCSKKSFEEALERADEVFIGRIIKAELYSNEAFNDSYPVEEERLDWRFYFEVKKKWKGNKHSKMIVYNLGTSCDYYFDIYISDYLVYASRRKEGSLWNKIGMKSSKAEVQTWLCSRTVSNNSWEEGNWYETDLMKLNEMFPEEVVLLDQRLSWLLGMGIIFFILIPIIVWKVY